METLISMIQILNSDSSVIADIYGLILIING